MSLTQIIDTWYLADGTLFSGTLVISPAPSGSGIVYADTKSLVAASITYQVQNGIVNLSLQANDIAQPSGTTYSVLVYVGRQVSWTEIWTVPSSTAPVALAAVRGLAQSLRCAAFFPSSNSWLLPASVYGTQINIPLILTYDTAGNQFLAGAVRNLSTGDTSVKLARAQAGVAEVLLSPKQYRQTIAAQTSVTISNTTAGLSNIIGVVVIDSTGNYIFEGVNISFSLIAASSAASQAASGIGGQVPFGSNFAGSFLSITISFLSPQTGTIVLLGS